MSSVTKQYIIIIGAMAGILGCLLDMGSSYVYGSEIKNYSQLHNTLSQMGIFKSAIAHKIDLFWIVMGLLLIVFGLSLRYLPNQKEAKLNASWLMILYGAGEGIGSGVFPVDKVGHFTWIGIIHNLVGGIGVFCLLVFPLTIGKIIPKLKILAKICFAFSLIGILLFLISRILENPNNVIVLYKGLWQRAYVLTFYGFVIATAINIIKINVSKILK